MIEDGTNDNKLIKNDSSVSIRDLYLQKLAKEMFKLEIELSTLIIRELFT